VSRDEKRMAHFHDPHNVGYIEAPDGVARVVNGSCGDAITMFVQVERNRIVDIKYLVRGCGTLTAACSAVSDLARGTTVDEAMRVTEDDVSRELGGLLPHDELHCATLAVTLLRRTIEDYRRRHRVDLHDWRSMYQNKT
jgi:nitrogen fixation protein NifU and related proteins